MPRQLNDWLKAFLEYTSYGEAPRIFRLWSGVSTIASVLGRKVYFDQGYFQWNPNFYIIFVAKSGKVTKSESIHSGERLLRKVPGISIGPNTITWQALVDAFIAAEQTFKIEGNDYIISCLTFIASELGVLLDTKDSRMMSTLTQLFDGDPSGFDKETRKDGRLSIQGPWLNIIAGTTPRWLSDNFTSGLSENGFGSRCLLIFTDKREKNVAYPKLHMPKNLPELESKLVQDLSFISTLKGEYGISKEAVKFGESWYEQFRETPPSFIVQDQLDGYLSRRQAHTHKLAMILAASKSDEHLITKKILEEAIEMIEEVEASLPDVFHFMGTSREASQVRGLESLLQSISPCTRSFLYRRAFSRYGMQIKEFNEGLDSMLEAGIAIIRENNDEMKLYYKEMNNKGEGENE